MSQKLHIERLSEDKLKSQQWWFYFSESDHTLFLDRYELSSRKTTRHKFQIDCTKGDHIYDRLHSRSTTIKEEEIPIPDDVRAEVLKTFIENLTVRKWGERNK